MLYVAQLKVTLNFDLLASICMSFFFWHLCNQPWWFVESPLNTTPVTPSLYDLEHWTLNIHSKLANYWRFGDECWRTDTWMNGWTHYKVHELIYRAPAYFYILKGSYYGTCQKCSEIFHIFLHIGVTFPVHWVSTQFLNGWEKRTNIQSYLFSFDELSWSSVTVDHQYPSSLT